MAKRGSRRPEKASTRPPARPKSSFPKTDPRPAARRGKAAGAPTKSPQTAKPANKAPIGGTSLSGKPTGPASVERIASTDASRRKPPVAEPKTKPRRLNERELRERDKRFREAFGKKRRLEKEKKRVTADLSAEIKELATECDQLHDELESGYEQLKQGELPLEAAEENAGASTPKITDATADTALAQVAAAAGESPKGNGKGLDGQEPKPAIDDGKAGAVRMAAATSGAADDIAAAVQREQGGEARP